MFNNRQAFTLIELIITIAIISLIAAAVFVSVDPAKRIGESKDSQRYSDLIAISKAVNLYTADYGELPPDLAIDNLKVGDKAVLCSQAQELSCDGQTHNCIVIDDSNFLGKYLTLPVDPNNSNDQDTGYYISRSSSKSIVFGACDSYLSGDLKIAAVTKVVAFKGIYRSVGPFNTTTLASGTTNAMSISGNDANFATALADNIGVGDVIQYDSNNSGTVDALAFIQGRYSSTHYNVVDVDGELPTETTASDTDWDIFRAYISLSNAETGTENTGIDNSLENFDTWSVGKDLVSADQQWNIALYGDAANTNTVSINGWTTSATNYIKIYTPYLASEVGVSQRHSGVWDDTKGRTMIVATSGYHRIINPIKVDIIIEGLQIKATNDGWHDTVGIQYEHPWSSREKAVVTYFRDNIIWGNITNNIEPAIGIKIQYWDIGHSGSIHYIYNNIVYGFNDNNSVAIKKNSIAETVYAYNNTVDDNYRGFRNEGGVFVSKNNIAQNCTDGFSGSFDAASDYNISDLASDAPGANSKNSTNVTFVNEAGDDFHLAAGDTAARGAAIDLSNDTYLSFTKDIDGGARTGTWDIGADEY